MAYISVPSCIPIGENLARLSNSENILYARAKTGMLDSLLAQREGIGWMRSPSGPWTGIQIPYTIKNVNSVSTVDTPCPSGSQAETKVLTVTPNEVASWTFEMSVDELNAICKSPDEIRALKLFEAMDLINQSINNSIITLVYTALGNYYGGTVNSGATPISVDLITGSPEAANYGEMYKIISEFKKITNGSSRPIIVGSGDLDKFVEFSRLGCCNAQGLDISQANGQFAYFVDYNMDTVINNTEENYIGYIPQSLKLITANKYRVPYNVVGNQESGELVDPRTGLTYDYYMKYDCEVWTITLKLFWGLYIQPDDIYTAPHNLAGVNQLLGFIKA